MTLLCASARSEDSEPITTKNILEILKTNWTTLRLLDEADQSYSFQRVDQQDDNPPAAMKGQVIRKGKCRKTMLVNESDPNERLDGVRNLTHAFWVKHKGIDLKQGWSLVELKRTADMPDVLGKEDYSDAGTQDKYPLSSIGQMTPRLFFAWPNMTITKVTTDDPSGFVIIEMTARTPDRPNKPKTASKAPSKESDSMGRLWVDPKMHWCVKKMDGYANGTLTLRFSRETAMQNGRPICTKHETRHGVDKSNRIDNLLSFTNYVFDGNVPDSEFTLSHYGLPEPPDAVKSKDQPSDSQPGQKKVDSAQANPRWPLFLGSIAAVFGAASIVLWRLAGRTPR